MNPTGSELADPYGINHRRLPTREADMDNSENANDRFIEESSRVASIFGTLQTLRAVKSSKRGFA